MSRLAEFVRYDLPHEWYRFRSLFSAEGRFELRGAREYANTGARGPGRNPSWSWRVEQALRAWPHVRRYERQLQREREWHHDHRLKSRTLRQAADYRARYGRDALRPGDLEAMFKDKPEPARSAPYKGKSS